jgi:hypothetical protein
MVTPRALTLALVAGCDPLQNMHGLQVQAITAIVALTAFLASVLAMILIDRRK